MIVSASAVRRAKRGVPQQTSLASEDADLGRFTVDRLMAIINRLGSRVEVKIKVRRAERFAQRRTLKGLESVGIRGTVCPAIVPQ